MKRISAKLSYANVMATVAVFLALGGGAYAATQLKKNSVGTKQIKKEAVTPVKLSKAAKSALTGAPGKEGAKGAKGERGEPGPLVETLPSGKTERGMYTWAGTKAGGGSSYSPATSVSYPIPLSFTPKVGQISVKGAPTTECPGSSEEPKAAPGYLCVYETRLDHGTLEVEVKETSQTQFGFALYALIGEGENFEYGGRWAVTAP